MSATQELLSAPPCASTKGILQRLLYERVGIVFLTLVSCSVIASDRFYPIQFTPPINFNLGSGPVGSLCAADFNGDGFPDLAVGHHYSFVAILTNNGSGGLALMTNIAVQVTTGSVSIGVGDFNGDGNTDVVTVGNYATLWLNDGTGTFTGTNIVYPDIGSGLMVISDFNRDGRADVANSANGVSIFLGQTNGTFTFASTNNVAAIAMATADFNGDTRPDLVTVSPYSRYTTVLIGNGNGTFAPPTNYDDIIYGGYRYCVAVGDVNNDEKPDIMAGNYGYRSISLRLNNGDGTFGPVTTVESPVSASALAVADFNGDGNSDIVVGNPLAILPGLGNGTFAPAITNISNYSPFPGANQSLVVADFDGDGRPDIATSSVTNNCVSILLNRTPPPVNLSIQNTSGLLVLNWPDKPGFSLESSTNPAVPSSWSVVTNPSFVINGQRIVVTTPDGDRRFFRLRK